MTKRFGGFTALDDVSLKVRPGSFHALLGENGAGKSTLVKCIMGYYQPDAGEVLVGDTRVPIENPREAHALGIGMVYQHFTLVGMTVAENLVLVARPRAGGHQLEEGARALDDVHGRACRSGCARRARCRALAAGEKQKLEILKQLYLKQPFLILDEPTSVLTPQEADEVLGLLRDMTRRAAS